MHVSPIRSKVDKFLF